MARRSTAGATQPEGDLEALLEGLPDNWGRWGDDDQRGALNVLGPAETVAGMRAVTGGRDADDSADVETFTLQLSMTGVLGNDPVTPQRVPARRANVRDERSYREGAAEPGPGGLKFADDVAVNPLFLQGTTHLDALGHTWYGDELYNGFDATTTATPREFDDAVDGLRPVDYGEPDPAFEREQVDATRGLDRVSVEPAAESGVVGRGVLLDVGRELGGESSRLEEGDSVHLADLLATADAQGVELRDRDVLLVRTGSIERVRDPDATWDPFAEPGLRFSDELVEWVHDRDIPLVGADNLAVERIVQVIDGEQYLLPLHAAFPRQLGVHLLEILDLAALGAQCARDGVYEFLFTAAPLAVERATGAPINPVVVKRCPADSP